MANLLAHFLGTDALCKAKRSRWSPRRTTITSSQKMEADFLDDRDASPYAGLLPPPETPALTSISSSIPTLAYAKIALVWQSMGALPLDAYVITVDSSWGSSIRIWAEGG